MTDDERIEKLKAHPDTLMLDVGGEKKHWFLGRHSFTLAKERGVPVDDIVGAGTDESTEAGIEQVCRLLWCGLLPFDHDLDIDEATMFLSLQELRRLEAAMSEPFTQFMEDSKKK